MSPGWGSGSLPILALRARVAWQASQPLRDHVDPVAGGEPLLGPVVFEEFPESLPPSLPSLGRVLLDAPVLLSRAELRLLVAEASLAAVVAGEAVGHGGHHITGAGRLGASPCLHLVPHRHCGEARGEEEGGGRRRQRPDRSRGVSSRILVRA